MRSKILIIIFMSYCALSYGQGTLSVIPRPAHVSVQTGQYKIQKQAGIWVKDSILVADATLFIAEAGKLYGPHFTRTMTGNANVQIKIERDTSLPKDGYKLTVNEKGVYIKGKEAGVYYALQTLKQIIKRDGSNALVVPYCTIEDHPAYSWRGMHLDVSRHFFPKDSVKKFIDAMAVHKMNVFHWHLTDDQGWRIEIKQYPKLTTIASKRKETIIGKNFKPFKGDGIPYGGFYTQDDIKDVVQYATARHITIVPEIEMPGHSQAALAAYPEYSCTGGPFEVMTTWGESEDVFCPREETFTFLQNILSEVFRLFPGKYIHIGGDEVPKTQWHNSTFCQQLMQQKGIKNEDELQSYFIRRIDSFITANGRSTIGWDEILEGGLAPNAAIMSWRGIEGGIAAARLKHNVVMCPGNYCYFDHYQGSPKLEPLAIGGYTTVEKVYSYNPLPDSLTADQQKYVLGAQGNVWTEYIASFMHVQYMAMPRLCALSEVLWSPKETRNYADFEKRLLSHLLYLRALGFNYANSFYDIQSTLKPNATKTGVELTLSCDIPTGKIVYTTDGTEPDEHAVPYIQPINIDKNTTVKAAYFENGILKSHIWQQSFHIGIATGKDITLQTPPSAKYNSGGAFTLVDGIHGIMPWYAKEWLGWSGKDCVATIDLGEEICFHKITISTLQDKNSWIYAPHRIDVSVSKDGREYHGTTLDEQQVEEGINKAVYELNQFKSATYRFIKITVYNTGIIPVGNPGAGKLPWLFIDEISVD